MIQYGCRGGDAEEAVVDDGAAGDGGGGGEDEGTGVEQGLDGCAGWRRGAGEEGACVEEGAFGFVEEPGVAGEVDVGGGVAPLCRALLRCDCEEA